MLTKKECDNALDRVARFCSWFSPYKCPECIKFKNELDILSDLIEEHFSNLPLKFEELKEGMWIWDNQLKWFFRVVLCDVKVQGCESLKMFKVKKYEGGSMLMIYEPNRFYRKEVQE